MARSDHIIVDESTVGNSSTWYYQHRTDENGASLVGWDGVGSFTLLVEGRMDANAPWAEVQSYDSTSTRLTNDNAETKTHKIYPEMRVSITAAAGGPTVNAWIIE